MEEALGLREYGVEQRGREVREGLCWMVAVFVEERRGVILPRHVGNEVRNTISCCSPSRRREYLNHFGAT